MKRTHSLEIRILNYFLLITIAAIMIGVEFYFELDRADLQAEICTISGFDPAGEGHFDFSGLQTKIAVMFAVLSLVAAIVLMMFVKTISMPLKRMLDSAYKINEGDLSQIIDIESQDEIGQLGIVINDLTSNFQELAASVLTVSTGIEGKLNSISSATKNNPIILSGADIASLKSDIGALKVFIESFDLLVADVPK